MKNHNYAKKNSTISFFSPLRKLNVEIGSPLRKFLTKRITNPAVLMALLVLLNRVFRLTRLILLLAPDAIIQKELALIYEAVSQLRELFSLPEPTDKRNQPALISVGEME